jgi:carboxymethylenebutenolidase
MSTSQPPGFLALPKFGKGPGVLVLHPWWGLNETIKSLCTRLSDSGFVAFAPDLYDGKVLDNIPDAQQLASAIFGDLDTPRAKLAQGVEFLAGRAATDNRGLAAVGFSMGGFFALDLSVSAPNQVRAVVVNYATRPGDDYGASKASYLGHFAETDPEEPKEGVDALEQSLRSAGRPVTFHHYPGTGHWFAEPDRTDAYNKEAAILAWNRTLDFLRGVGMD